MSELTTWICGTHVLVELLVGIHLMWSGRELATSMTAVVAWPLVLSAPADEASGPMTLLIEQRFAAVDGVLQTTGHVEYRAQLVTLR